MSTALLVASADYALSVAGLDALVENAHRLDAKVTLDTDQDQARVQVTATTTDTDPMNLTAKLAALTKILPAEAIVQTSSWRITGEPPF